LILFHLYSYYVYVGISKLKEDKLVVDDVL